MYPALFVAIIISILYRLLYKNKRNYALDEKFNDVHIDGEYITQLTPDEIVDWLQEKIVRANAQHNEDAIWEMRTSLFYLARKKRGGDRYVLLLGELLLQDYHSLHPEIAQALKKIHSPLSVDSLYQRCMSCPEDMEAEDFMDITTICIAGLRDVGTAEAFQRLKALSLVDVDFISYDAQKQLEHWPLKHIDL
jgi:hypothetical protein